MERNSKEDCIADLSSESIMEVDQEIINRIHEKTMRKAGFLPIKTDTGRKPHGKVLSRKLVGIAAMVAIVVGVVLYNNESIVNAFHQVVTYIQGYGMVEKRGPGYYNPDNTVDLSKCDYFFTYTPDELCVDNGKCQILVTNSYVIGDTLTLSWMITGMEKSYEIEGEPKIALYANDKECERTAQKITAKKNEGNHIALNGTYEYKLSDVTISPDTNYKMEYEELNVKYQLEKCMHANSYGEIVSHNGIGYTTESFLENGVLTVYMYNVNQSPLPYGLKDADPCTSYKDVYLETDQGRIYASGGKKYTFYGKPDEDDEKDMRKAPYYTFNIPEGMKKANLVVPYITCEPMVNNQFTIPYLKEGESLTLDKDINLGLAHIKLDKVEISKEDTLTLYFTPNESEKRKIVNDVFMHIDYLNEGDSYTCGQSRDNVVDEDRAPNQLGDKDRFIFDATLNQELIEYAKENGYPMVIDYADMCLDDDYVFNLEFDKKK